MASKTRKVIETLFNIFDKEGNLVPFKFNDIQARIDEEIIEPLERFRERRFESDEQYPQDLLRNTILKYRQGGVTTLIMAWYLVECMTRYSVCVMLTHDKEHSEKLLYRARLMLKHLNGPKPQTSKLNDNEIAFGKTDSVFYIGTAGSKEFGRSATITHLHCSEIAFWKDPASLMKSLFQAVPKRSGIITQETTANGWGTWFQKSFYNYLDGKGGFRPHFYPWYIHNEYISTTPWGVEWSTDDFTEFKRGSTFVRVPNEKILYRRIKAYSTSRNLNWTREDICAKLQWRREKILENLGDKSFRDALRDFNQEYPSTYEEAFCVTGGSLFPDVRCEVSSRWVSEGTSVKRLNSHPVKGFTYTLGADFAGGTGNDESSINVLCLETKEQVYRFADAYIDPIAFAEKIVEVGREFDAYLTPECNAHGLAGLVIVKRSYDFNKIYKRILPTGKATNGSMNIQSYGYGWLTSNTSKPYMIGIAQQFLRLGWKLYDEKTVDQLRSFTEDPETGKMEGQGDHDDCGISFMLACIGMLRMMRRAGKYINDYNEEAPLEVPIVPEVVTVKPTQHTHRDERGNYLISFDHMFGKRRNGRRSVHV